MGPRRFGSASGDITLKDAFFNIQVLQQAASTRCCAGLPQQAQEVDTQYVDGLRNFLFSAARRQQVPDARGVALYQWCFPGLDLPATSSGRDMALTANDALGLKRLETFEDHLRPGSRAMAQTDNNDINNVDLYVAGLAEDHVEGSSLGEVSNVIKRQFEAIRGDRF